MGGIGTAICKRLAKDGHKVVANCLPGYDKKDEWIEVMRGEGADVYAAEGSVENHESCAEMMDRVRSEVGSIDILVNNAGITRDGMFRRMSPTDWYAVINTNLNSVFNVTRQVIDGMMERTYGRIVNISSDTISPGYVATDMVRAIKAEVLQQIVNQIPMGRLAEPEEIGGLVSYLTSDEAGYITGSNISINGGLYML